MRFKIEWASLMLGGNLPFLLCFTLYFRAISKYKTPPGLHLEGRFNGGYLRYEFGGGGAYIWRGLFLEFYGSLVCSPILLVIYVCVSRRLISCGELAIDATYI